MPTVSWANDSISDEDLFRSLCAIIRSRVPKFEIRYKDRSTFQKILGFIAFFCKEYMTKYTTTLGHVVYFPSEEFVQKNRWKAFKVLAHEYVHLLDWQASPVFSTVMYALPQIVAIVSLVAILAAWFSYWYLLFLVFLIFVGPWGSPSRATLEQRGYAMNIAINMWRYGSLSDKTEEWLVEAFTGMDYYRMLPDEGAVRGWIDETVELVRNSDSVGFKDTVFDDSAAFEDVYELLTGITFDTLMEE